MNKAEVVKKHAKALKGAKLKSLFLAVASGIVTGLMYHVGVHAGVNATCKSIAESFPEEEYESVGEAENKDAN